MAAATDTDVAGLEAKIKEQGDQVRDLKAAKASKEDIDAAVAVLKELKADFEAQAGPMELPTNENNNNLLRIRHSSAHVMAMAVQRLYPKAQVTIARGLITGFTTTLTFRAKHLTTATLKRLKKKWTASSRKNTPSATRWCHVMKRAHVSRRKMSPISLNSLTLFPKAKISAYTTSRRLVGLVCRSPRGRHWQNPGQGAGT